MAGGALTWDPKASPGTVDLAKSGANTPADLCRYRLDADTLVLSVSHLPDLRPAGIDPGEKVTVWVFKRVRPKD